MNSVFKFIFLFITFLVSIFFSCKKKKEDTKDPVISVLSPGSGSTYNVFDTIRVKLQLSDETNLSKIDISLHDQNDAPVQTGVSQSISGTSYIFECDLIIYEYKLETGTYRVSCTLSDGYNSTVKNIDVHITASPTYKTGYFFITQTTGQFIYNKLDSNFNSIDNFSIPGNYISSELSSYYQLLYCINPPDKDFAAYNLNTKLNSWTLSNSSTAATITCSNCDGKNIFLGKNDCNIYKYNYQGIIQKTYHCNEPNYYVTSLFNCGDYQVVNIKNFANTSSKVVVFDSNYGLIKQVLQNKEITAAFGKSSTEVYLVSNNSSGNAVIEVLNLQTSNLYQSALLGNYLILSACQINTGVLLVALADGKVYYYNNSNNTFMAVCSDGNMYKMKYSEKFNELYTCNVKTFYTYSVGNFLLSPVGSFVNNDTIRDFHVIFNK